MNEPLEENPTASSPGKASARPRIPWWRRRATKLVAGSLAGALIALVILAEYALHHLEPIVRERLIQTLSESFNSPVELDSLRISLFHGIQVEGEGLRIPYGSPPNGDPAARAGPLLSLQHFRFRTTLGGLLRHTTHVEEFRAEGVEIHIPPHSQRGVWPGSWQERVSADPAHTKLRPRIAFTASRIVNDDMKLYIETDTPGKEALEFDVRHLQLEGVGPDRPATFTADLVNAEPKGDIHAAGYFGPWASEDPRETPVQGDFTFMNADLGTIKGISGTLRGAGHFAGQLESMVVDGTADVPNFSLDTANHPVPLFTRYHAIVDGTTGDTTLAPVQALLDHSDFSTSGTVMKVPGGHDIALDVNIPSAEVADFLRLAVKTSPALMNGRITMQARLHIPPGPERVPVKMGLQGRFHIAAVHFSNTRFQDRVDGLSARAQGHPEEADSVSNDAKAEAASRISATVVLARGLLTATDVRYTLPGAVVTLNGVYSMDGNLFEFKGRARTEATASQMVGGWKGLLLKPLDRFLQEDGAGLQVPVEVSGTQGDVQFGLALQDASETTQGMARDLQDRRAAGAGPTKHKH